MLIIRHEFGIIFLEINRGAVIRPGTEDIQLEKKKLGGRILFNIILFGFIGQVAWAVENVYFNTFLFNYIGGTADDIAKMVAASAIAAVATTFIMGTLSDKLDRRKIFISGGYIIWGFTVAVFAFISRDNIGKLFNISDTSKVVAATVCVVIIMDCVMTFFGSTSNDAAFNAWITDVTVPENRGTAEAVLALLPVFATVIVTVAFGVGVEAAGYPACFMFLGALVTICGIIGLFSVKDPRKGVKQSTNYFSDLIYGFRPSVIKNNAALYLCLASACIFNTAVQVFMPYIFIYVQHYLKFDLNTFQITTPIIIGGAAAVVGLVVVTILLGKLLDKVGKRIFVFPAVLLFVAGLVAVFFAKTLLTFVLFALIMILGYGLLMIILNATVRDYTPEDKVGQFQGVRLLFTVTLPMIIGPKVGSWTISEFSGRYELGTMLNEYGESTLVPIPTIFLVSAIIAVLIIVPLIFLAKVTKEKKA